MVSSNRRLAWGTPKYYQLANRVYADELLNPPEDEDEKKEDKCESYDTKGGTYSVDEQLTYTNALHPSRGTQRRQS